jgi:hypothetical protein
VSPDGGAQSGTPPNYSEINYDTTLFSGVSNGASTPNVGAGPLSDTSAAAQAAAAAGGSPSASGVQFNLIADPSTPSGNAWSDGSTGHPVLDIPVNVFGVSSVWTMLNAENGLGTTGTQFRDVWVALDFASTPGATTNLTTVTVKLNNSANSTTKTGSIQNALDCSAGCGANNYSAGANGPTVVSGAPAAGLENTGGLNSMNLNTNVASQLTIDTNTLFSFQYACSTGCTNDGTAGNAVLDDQGIVFNSGSALQALAESSYLVDVRVYESGTTTYSGAALSAITVETTPEPSTVLLFLTGLAGLGLARWRRVRA